MSTDTRERLKSKATTKPYSNMSYATEPGKFVLFSRSCILYQLYQFFRLNLKVMRIVIAGHS
jgi:hypothetical protein